MIDFLFAIATLIFSVTMFIQIHKNYKIKKITSQSILWHISSLVGLFIVLVAHYIGGFWFSFFITIVNILERITIIIQIRIYWVGETWKNKK